MSKATSQLHSDTKIIVIVMGVSGCGKSTIAELLAQRLGFPYVDADNHHPAPNIEKMSNGIPLTDEDRWPWLKDLSAFVEDKADEHGGAIVACSALRRTYRDFLTQNIDLPVFFVLLDGERETLFSRLSSRKGHYMPASLVDSQLAILERPQPDEKAVTVSIEQSVEAMTDQLEQAFQQHKASFSE